MYLGGSSVAPVGGLRTSNHPSAWNTLVHLSESRAVSLRDIEKVPIRNRGCLFHPWWQIFGAARIGHKDKARLSRHKSSDNLFCSRHFVYIFTQQCDPHKAQLYKRAQKDFVRDRKTPEPFFSPPVFAVAGDQGRQRDINVDQVFHGKSASSSLTRAEVNSGVPTGVCTTKEPVTFERRSLGAGATLSEGVKTMSPPLTRHEKIIPGFNPSRRLAPDGKTICPLLESVVVMSYCLTALKNVKRRQPRSF